MPDEAAFDRAVARLAEFVDRIDDAVVDAVEDPDSGRRTGHVVERGTYTYRIVGDPRSEYFTVTFPFSIVAQLSGLLTEEDAQFLLEQQAEESGVVPGALVDAAAEGEGWADVSEAELTTQAAITALERVSEPTMEEFVYHLIVVLNAGTASFSLQTTEGGVVSGYTVSTKLFPFEASFDLPTFERRVEAVVTTGIGGLVFVNQSFDFQSMVDTAELTGMLPWYIH